MNGNSTVYLLDEDQRSLNSMRNLLISSGYHVQRLYDLGSFLDSTKSDAPSCLIADLAPGWMTRFEQLRRGSSEGSLCIIVVSADRDIQTAVRAVKCGATDFLTRPIEEGALLKAVDAALRDAWIKWRKHQTLRNVARNYRTLTPREQQVLPFIVNGLLNKQTAHELGTSEITIRIHRGKIMRKMKADSLPHLVKLALMLGIGRMTTSHASLATQAARRSVSQVQCQ